MPEAAETNAFLPGKRKSETSINLTYLKKAHVESTADEEGKDQQQDENHGKQSSYPDIPKEMFIRICSYLSFKEIVRLGRVCRRWYNLSRSSVFWERSDLVSLNLPPQKSQQFLLKLPACVKELRIGSCSGSDARQTLSVPALYNTLFSRFPILEVLIIENVFLVNPSCDFFVHEGFMLNCKVPMHQQVRKNYITMKYRVPTANADFYSLISRLRDIIVLSLRSSVLAVEDGSSCEDIRNTPSRIRILDLTKCACAMDQTIKSFCQLPFLEELYLAGTAITVNGVSIVLREVHRLKVLDLDNTLVGSETFAILRRHGQSLVKLYLGKTAVKDSDIIAVGEETFPVLEKLCLQRTAVSEIGVHNLIHSVHSLMHIVLTKSKVNISWMLEQSAYIRTKFEYDYTGGNKECNHFLQKKLSRNW